MGLPPGRARAFETAGKQGCDCVAWSRKRRTGFASRQGVYESPRPSSYAPTCVQSVPKCCYTPGKVAGQRTSTLKDWPPCPPIQRGGGERSRPGVSPFISALTVSCRPATFPGVWPHIWSRCPELWDFLSHRPGAEDEGRGLS